MTTERTAAADELAKTLREAITRLNRRVRQARPVGDLTFSQLSALTSLQLAGGEQAVVANLHGPKCRAQYLPHSSALLQTVIRVIVV